MAKAFALPQSEDEGLLESFRALGRALLQEGSVEALLAHQQLPRGHMVQHVLVRDPALLEALDPVAPVLPVNGGVLAARLTRQDPGGMIAALLRPCEIRAFVELVKLHQGDRDRLLLLGIDCMGTFEPPAFQQWAKENPDGSVAFLQAMRVSGAPPDGAPSLRHCCRACEYPTPEGADVHILLLENEGDIPCLMAATSKGEASLEALGLQSRPLPAQREEAVEALRRQRMDVRDRLFENADAELLPLEALLGELSSCINCHNCRDVCPACYCKSCVFDGSTFEHPASQYVRWAKRKGRLKMPSETLFFHLTRMAHMSTSCVGCGQCSSACPMGIRVAEIFRAVARRTQGAFGYVPGRDLEEPLPLATFREEELTPR